jgi:hypothetical protein
MPESNPLLLATLEFHPNYFTARFFIDEQLTSFSPVQATANATPAQNGAERERLFEDSQRRRVTNQK